LKYLLHKQKPTPRKVGISGTLSVTDGVARFWAGETLVTELHKPEIIFINPDGIRLRGFEPAGYTKSGVQRFEYQEWMVRYDI
jgi:hypothetical protein